MTDKNLEVEQHPDGGEDTPDYQVRAQIGSVDDLPSLAALVEKSLDKRVRLSCNHPSLHELWRSSLPQDSGKAAEVLPIGRIGVHQEIRAMKPLHDLLVTTDGRLAFGTRTGKRGSTS